MSKIFCRDDTNFFKLSAVEILKKYFQNNISIFEESLGSFCMLLIMATTGWLSGEKFPSENLVTKFIARLQDRALVTIFNNFI